MMKLSIARAVVWIFLWATSTANAFVPACRIGYLRTGFTMPKAKAEVAFFAKKKRIQVDKVEAPVEPATGKANGEDEEEASLEDEEEKEPIPAEFRVFGKSYMDTLKAAADANIQTGDWSEQYDNMKQQPAAPTAREASEAVPNKESEVVTSDDQVVPDEYEDVEPTTMVESDETVEEITNESEHDAGASEPEPTASTEETEGDAIGTFAEPEPVVAVADEEGDVDLPEAEEASTTTGVSKEEDSNADLPLASTDNEVHVTGAEIAVAAAETEAEVETRLATVVETEEMDEEIAMTESEESVVPTGADAESEAQPATLVTPTESETMTAPETPVPITGTETNAETADESVEVVSSTEVEDMSEVDTPHVAPQEETAPESLDGEVPMEVPSQVGSVSEQGSVIKTAGTGPETDESAEPTPVIAAREMEEVTDAVPPGTETKVTGSDAQPATSMATADPEDEIDGTSVKRELLSTSWKRDFSGNFILGGK